MPQRDADAFVEQAVEALSQGDKATASRHYEAAAHMASASESATSEPNLLLLAARYEETDFHRADSLHEAAQRIYEMLGRTTEIIDTLILRATLAERWRRTGDAMLMYTSAINRAARLIVEASAASLACHQALVLEGDVGDVITKLIYCRDRLHELAMGEEG